VTQLPEDGYQFGDVVVDVLNLRLTVSGVVRLLEPKSFRLLQFLVENRRRVVPKDEILNVVWEG
jgi:DNA-binding winged helix-turn-helix (wHTH) protein